MSEWISVKDRLPKENEELLMTYNNLVMEGTFVRGSFYRADSCAHVPLYCTCYPQEGITDWMPLPKPPEKKEI